MTTGTTRIVSSPSMSWSRSAALSDYAHSVFAVHRNQI
jgi:hypothetical protein